MPYSGKSEAVKIAQKRGYPVTRMGDMVWEETKRQGLQLTDHNVGSIATKLRKTKGQDIWAQRTVEKIRKYETSKIVIIDGIRNKAEVTYFKKNLSDDFILVAIQTNTSLRYNRAMTRGRIDDALSLIKIKQRDKREISWGLEKIIDAADIIITNNDKLEDFQIKINDFFNDIEKR